MCQILFIYCCSISFPLLLSLAPSTTPLHSQSAPCCACPWVFYMCCFLKYILLIMLLQLSHFPPSLFPSILHHPPTSIPHLSSFPWVVHKSSLTSTFPMLVLTSPSLFCRPFMLLIPCTFPPFSPLHLPTDNPPCVLHFCDSIPILVVCLVCFFWVFFCLRF